MLAEKYCDMAATGWQVTTEEIQRDVREILGGGFLDFVERDMRGGAAG